MRVVVKENVVRVGDVMTLVSLFAVSFPLYRLINFLNFFPHY